eukprot:CAMPEP_0168785340 /NCGR_PEP_ID=MMETSP0725-20121227/10697_1 /TAXON_ID=265536 /ORGANISM="Amphiprora sp., Strain CCMP467" /LENGTH=377 /DNA_ID=CAMNT_0008835437 /DNA_START=38 /DNA_END=1168 /DNA_ORIENTATION=+
MTKRHNLRLTFHVAVTHWCLNGLGILAFSHPSIHRREHDASATFQTTLFLASPPRRSKSKNSIANSPQSKQNTLPQQHPSFRGVDIRTQLDYARDGHAVIRRLIDPQYVTRTLQPSLLKHAKKQELLAWRQKVEVVLGSKELADACGSVTACQEKLQRHFGKDHDLTLPFLQYFNNWQHIKPVADLVHSETLARTAAQLLGIPSVRLYQDSLFWKRVGDGPTPWHADARMAPFDTSLMITFWIPLQALNTYDSALIFCSKSHSDFALPFWNQAPKDDCDASPEEDSEWFRLEERYDTSGPGDDGSGFSSPSLVDYLPMCVGDVTVHSGWTLHSADPAVEQDRAALAATYVDSRAPIRSDAVLSANTNEGRGDNEDAW